MKKLFILLFAAAFALSLFSCDADAGKPTDPAGSWLCETQSAHGYAEYYWSFGADGRFACYFAGFESPLGDVPHSMSENFMTGKFRENGGTVECSEVHIDSCFEFGGEWRYFEKREPAEIADMLLKTPLTESEGADDFSFEFELKNAATLRIAIDRGVPPYQYDMDFEYIDAKTD